MKKQWRNWIFYNFMTTISNNDIARAIYLSVKEKSDAEQILFFPKLLNFYFGKDYYRKLPTYSLV